MQVGVGVGRGLMPQQTSLRAVDPHEGPGISPEPRCPARAGKLFPVRGSGAGGTHHSPGVLLRFHPHEMTGAARDLTESPFHFALSKESFPGPFPPCPTTRLG